MTSEQVEKLLKALFDKVEENSRRVGYDVIDTTTNSVFLKVWMYSFRDKVRGATYFEPPPPVGRRSVIGTSR